MAKNEKEYAELLALRNALICRDAADEEYEKAKKRLDSYTFTYDPPESITVNSYTKRMIEIFEAPTVNVEKAKAAKRDKWLNFFKNIFLVLAAIGVLFGGFFLVKLVAVWSWNASITGMVTDIYMSEIITYDIAVGIHLFALCVLLAVAAIFCGGIAATSNGLFAIGSVVCGLGGVVSLFASFGYFYSEAEGFWSVIGYFFSSLLYTPKFFGALLYVIPFCLAAMGSVALAVYLIYLCTKGIATEVDTYVKPNIDLTKLKSTKEYKHAEKMDAEATAKAREEYAIVYEKAKERFCAKGDLLVENVNRFVDIYNDCIDRINAVKCLPDDKKTFEWVSIILHYINKGVARDSVDALREYKHDLQIAKLRQTIEDMKARHEEELQEAFDSGYKKAKGEAASQIRSLMKENERLEKDIDRANREFDRCVSNLQEGIDRAERHIRYAEEDYYRILKYCEIRGGK